jgi:hypothetical protein
VNTGFERLRDALTQHGSPLRQSGPNWTARCPGHDDRNASLSVGRSEGMALVHCHAGCDTADVLAALGLTLADLFDNRSHVDYVYRHADGTAQRKVRRTPEKQFWQREQDGTPPILYGLPEVVAAVEAGQSLYLVEGEKDCHSLANAGVLATTAPMGSGSFGKVDVEPLRGAHVTAIVDRDEAGDRWAETVRTRLAGLAARLRFQHAVVGKDATDHLMAGHGVDDFVPYQFPEPRTDETDDVHDADVVHREAVDRHLRDLRVREEAKQQFAAEEHARTWTPPADYGSLADELAMPDDDPQWRVQGLLGVGHNAIVVAGRKAGKTTLVGNLARSYADGKPFLGQFGIERADAGIAIFNYEVDEWQFRRWMRDLDIENTDRVFPLHVRGRTLPVKNARVRAWVTRWLRDRGIGMWIVDPYSRAYVGSLDNGNDEAQVGGFLDTLDVIKADAGVSELVMPVHTPKAKAEAGEETAIGSQRLEGWPDSMWYLTRDLETGERFLRAEGRDVDLPEGQLFYNHDTRELALSGGGGRGQVRSQRDIKILVEFVTAHPGCTKNAIKSAINWGYKKIDSVAREAGDLITVEHGPNNSQKHYAK